MSSLVDPLPPAGNHPRITLNDVSFAYLNAKPVLLNLDLTIYDNEFFVLLGPSGCGKTTVLNLIAGFERTVSGSLTVGDAQVTKPGIDRVVVFQGDDSLLGWRTVEQNVEFGLELAGSGKSERRERAARAIETVGLRGHEKKYPRELSGGMKQRVQIARALVSDSPVMLMDEPFGALDAMTRTSLQDEISRIWLQDKRTIVFITHDIAEAVMLGDRIGIMAPAQDGKAISIVENTFPRPRSRGAEEFARNYGLVEDTLRHITQSASESAAPTPSTTTANGA